MHDRSALGPADVTDDQLPALAAASLASDPRGRARRAGRGVRLRPAGDHDRRSLLGPRHAPTAAARRGRSGCSSSTCSRWARSPVLRDGAAEQREAAAEARPLADRGARLPLRPRRPAPRRARHAARARRLRPRREVRGGLAGGGRRRARRPWDVARYARAAHLLGRLAASARVAERWPTSGGTTSRCHDYLAAGCDAGAADAARRRRLAAPAGRRRRFDDDLRDRSLDAADAAAGVRRRAVGAARMPAHGDACPNNLLARPATTTSCSSTTASGRPYPSASTSASCSSATSRSDDGSGATWPASDDAHRRGVHRRAARRGCDVPRRRRTPRPRAAPDALHRALDAAVRAPVEARGRLAASFAPGRRSGQAIARLCLRPARREHRAEPRLGQASSRPG